MPESIQTEVEGRKLKLSNPQKVLYPEFEVTKAEVIQYYLTVADLFLKHCSDRPLTLIRFPDGVNGKRFYSKNKPNWTPEWIASTLFGDDQDNQYLLAKEKATLAWLANLAALEIHPMNVRSPNLDLPDQFIFDLDPSVDFGFDDLKQIAIELRELLIDYGYHPFIKTSGGKGLHIYVPIKPIYHRDMVFDVFQNIAKEYVKSNQEKATLTISKEKRKGKVLIDILRNRSSNSCVAPYSLRGKTGAPVSMPFPWEMLSKITASNHFNIRTALRFIEKNGDAWDTIWSEATSLHTEKKQTTSLSTYDAKRDFSKTSEPTGVEKIATSGKDYVIQLHDASNLHYDLRLEENGVLISWAIPKGLPHEVGVKRLAIRTEDHPLKYLHFEGEIPKQEYGGGRMWIFDSGQYELVKKSDKKYHFHLTKGKLDGTYIIYNTKDNQWIIERKTETGFAITNYKAPMLADVTAAIPALNHFYEIKWDGLRAIFYINKGNLTIYSRNGNDITKQFPELQIMTQQIEAESVVLDGEIVHLDQEGKPNFSKIVGRIHVVGEKSIANAAKKNGATAYLFDLLHLDGKDCRGEPNLTRRKWLQAILTTGDRIRFSDAFPNGKDLFQAIQAQGMEGIICKSIDGTYLTGQRNKDWLKVKVRHEDVAFIIGYTKGEGDRQGLFGSLHLAKKTEKSWQYFGRVGTGFSTQKLKEIYTTLREVSTSDRFIDDVIEKEHETRWIKPIYRCEIEYASLSSNGTYREPVFKRILDQQ